MGQTPRDHRTEPSLELPSLPGFGRRKKSRKSRRTAEPPEPASEGTAESPEPMSEGTAESPESAYDGTEAAADRASVVDAESPPSAESSLHGHGPDTQGLNGHGPDIHDLDGHGPDTHDLDGHGPDGQDLDTQAPRRRAEKRRTEKTPKEPRKRPLLPGPLAAVLTGIFVGAAGAAGTYGAMTGCEVVRGVSTCGGAPGFFVLVAIVALMVLLGAGVLHLARVEDPASTSFLAVGLVAVIAMLVLLDVIFSPWMFVVIPALTALSFLVAQWVTSRFTEDTGRRDWT